MRTWCVVGLLMYTGVAVAQPAAPPASRSSEAAALFEAGRALLAGHHAAEACAKFARALELEPGDVGVMLNLGLCNEELDKLATALTWFRRARVRASASKLAESTRAASEKITVLSRAVGTARLTLSPPAVVVTVTVDGTPFGASDLGRVELDAGHHAIEVTAAGAAVVHQEVDVVDGAAASVELVVPPPRGPPAPVTTPRDVATPAASGRAHAQHGRAYVVGANGGGLVLGSVALGLAGRRAVGATEHPDVQQHWRDAVMYGGTSMFVLGSAALGWATWSYLAPSEPGDRTIVAPVVGNRSVEIAVQGAF